MKFVNEEIILMVDEDYDNYGTPNTSRVDKESFTEPATTEETSTLWLNQKAKRNEFYNGDRWVPLTKRTDEFCAPKTLRDGFGGVNTTKTKFRR